jgi:hypothetical protein
MVKKLFSIFGNFHYLKITFLLDLLLLMGNSKNKRGLNSQKKGALPRLLALACWSAVGLAASTLLPAPGNPKHNAREGHSREEWCIGIHTQMLNPRRDSDASHASLLYVPAYN